MAASISSRLRRPSSSSTASSSPKRSSPLATPCVKLDSMNPPLRPLAAEPDLVRIDQHDVAAAGRAPWRRSPSTIRCSRRRRCTDRSSPCARASGCCRARRRRRTSTGTGRRRRWRRGGRRRSRRRRRCSAGARSVDSTEWGPRALWTRHDARGGRTSRAKRRKRASKLATASTPSRSISTSSVAKSGSSPLDPATSSEALRCCSAMRSSSSGASSEARTLGDRPFSESDVAVRSTSSRS